MQMRPRTFALSIAAAMIMGGVMTAGLFFQGAAAVSNSQSSLSKVDEVYSILRQDYFTPLDHEKAVEGAINGMVKALEDPYSTYMTPTETSDFMESVQGKFEGIGAEIREENGQIVVVTPILGSPSEKAGIKPNDILLEVNGIKLSGMKASEAVTHVRGPKGTEAKLLIDRPGYDRPFQITLIRDTIPLNTVFSRMLDGELGYIQITKVSEETNLEFGRALEQLKSSGAKGIVLDVRQNPGGLLKQAVQIAEHFVPNGKLILQVKYPGDKVQVHRSQSKQNVDLPVVLLIDRGSASAAEIIAGALRESAGVTLVGENTFGKGTVQNTASFNDGSSLKYTSAQWLTPEGNHIHKVGIKPDVEVKLPDYAELPYPFVEREYKQGEEAEPIKIVQSMLRALGHDPGREDGRLDEKTAMALQAFQAANGLSQTGTLNEQTTRMAITQLQSLLKANDTQLAKAQEVLRELVQKR